MIRNSELDRCGILFYARSGTPLYSGAGGQTKKIFVDLERLQD
jgi:hypothetical protein